MTSFWRDLRHALRFLAFSPVSHVASLLRSRIGANTAIFQLIDSIRLRTITAKNPQDWGPSGLRIATGVRPVFEPVSQLTFAIGSRSQAPGRIPEIAVWSDNDQSGTGGECPQSKRLSRPAAIFFTSLWSSRFLGGCLAPG